MLRGCLQKISLFASFLGSCNTFEPFLAPRCCMIQSNEILTPPTFSMLLTTEASHPSMHKISLHQMNSMNLTQLAILMYSNFMNPFLIWAQDVHMKIYLNFILNYIYTVFAQHMNNFNCLLRFIIVGDTCNNAFFLRTPHNFLIVVGKSCFLTQFTDHIFKNDFEATIGVDFASKTITVKEKKVKLQIWDTVISHRLECHSSNT